MKTLLIAFSTLLCSFSTPVDNPVDLMGISGPLEFNNTKFHLTWSSKLNDSMSVQEYVPSGESVEHFHQMMTIHLYDTDAEVKTVVSKMVRELEESKKSDPVCQYSVIKSPDGKEFILDCILSSSKDNRLTVAEFIVYRFRQVELINQNKAVFIYQYSRRSYGSGITPFLTSLKEERQRLLKLMTSATLPTEHFGDG